MDITTEEHKLELHILVVQLFKKVIEAAIEFEKKEETTFGYRLIESDEDNDTFFRDQELFYSLMRSKKIIFKSKLRFHQMFFPMYILSMIINMELFVLHDYGFQDDYIRYLQENNLIENNFDLKPIKEIIEKMLEEPGEFWINHSGKKHIDYGVDYVKEDYPIIFNFDDSVIQHYYLETDCSEKYLAKRKRNIFVKHPDGREEMVEKIIITDEIRRKLKMSKQKRFLKNMKTSSKFLFIREEDLIEYTLEDILNYLNNQLEGYERYKKMNEVQEEAIKEAKNPKMLQRCLDAGQSIDEALNSVGYN